MADDNDKTNQDDSDDKQVFDNIKKDLTDLLRDKYNINAVFGFQQPGETMAEEEPEEANIELSFNFKPKEVKSYLDRYVIKQDEAKKALSIAICDHFNHIAAIQSGVEMKDYIKQNIIMIGPTGVGKTYLIKNLADLVGVPFVKGDATKYSETGYIGGDVEDLVRQLVKKANGNVELAEYGIIFLDEIDKIATSPNMQGRDVGGRGVQSNLLKLMEDTDVPLATPWDIQSQLQNFMGTRKAPKRETINTKHILFIVSGVFDGLLDTVQKRIQGGQIGFLGQEKQERTDFDILSQTSTEDLIKYGMEPEFIGRLPVRVFCQNLNETDLFNILKYSEGSILKQYITSFNAYGIDIFMEDSALMEIARQAAEEKTGARSLGTVLERTFRDFKFELPSTDVTHFTVSSNLVKAPRVYLRKIVNDPYGAKKRFYYHTVNDYVARLAERTGIAIDITPEAQDYIITRSLEEGHDIQAVCQELFSNYEYGLNIIKRNNPDGAFVIDMDVIHDPQQVLEERIRESIVQKRA